MAAALVFRMMDTHTIHARNVCCRRALRCKPHTRVWARSDCCTRLTTGSGFFAGFKRITFKGVLVNCPLYP